MFKFLASKKEDPGFPNAVIVTNKSVHWLVVDDVGHRIPPLSHAAMDAPSVAASSKISEHVEAGLISVSANPQQEVPVGQKRKKRHEKPEQDEPQKQEVQPEQGDEPVLVTPEAVQAGENEVVQSLDTLVAEPEQQNWVSSNENIVGLPTTDEI